jgi:hypothetical protein
MVSRPEHTTADNPAERLYQILDEARLKLDTNKVAEVWASVLGITPRDTFAMLAGINEILNLVNTTKKHLAQLDVSDHKLYLSPFANIERLFENLNLGATWGDRKRFLDEITMQALRFDVDALSKVVSEPSITKDDLAALQEDVETLLKRVLDIELTEKLKAVLIEKLESIRGAILAYRFSGTSGLRRALEVNLGAVFLHQAELEKAQDDETSQFLAKLKQMLGRLALMVMPGLAEGLTSGAIEHLLQAGGK